MIQYDKNFNYSSKKSTKLKINNIKHQHSKERISSKKIRIISDSHGI